MCSIAFVPLGVIETSHFARQPRRRAAADPVAGLGTPARCRVLPDRHDGHRGIAASLLKGFDYEEAACCCSLLLIVLWRARPAFDRRAAFFDTRFSSRWIAAVAGRSALRSGSGFFAFKHVDYSQSALVAVRAAGRCVALSPRLGRRRRRGRCCSRFARCSSGARRTRRRRRRCRSRGRREGDRGAVRPRLRTSSILRDKALLFNDDRDRVHHVRRAGAHVGGARRSGRSRGSVRRTADPALPRTLRRLRRRAGVLRDRQARSALLCRLRPDVRQARRGSAGRPRRLHARRRPRATKYGRRCGGSRTRAARFRVIDAARVPALLPSSQRCPTTGSRPGRRRRRASRSDSSTTGICRGFRSR